MRCPEPPTPACQTEISETASTDTLSVTVPRIYRSSASNLYVKMLHRESSWEARDSFFGEVKSVVPAH